MRHDLGMLRADMVKRFDQSASVAATLEGHIKKANDNVDTLNKAVHQSRNILDVVATDVGRCHQSLETVKNAVGESRLYLRDRIGDMQNTVTQATDSIRQELSRFITTSQTSLVTAIGTAQNKISHGINSLSVAITAITGAFERQLFQTRDAIITATSLTFAPSREVLDSKIQELRADTDQTRASIRSLADTLQTGADEAKRAVEDAANAREKARTEIEGKLQELHDRVEEIKLEMRAGHFNSAARLANRLSSCCTSTIYKLHGVDNMPIHDLPKTYAGLGDLQGKPSKGRR